MSLILPIHYHLFSGYNVYYCRIPRAPVECGIPEVLPVESGIPEVMNVHPSVLSVSSISLSSLHVVYEAGKGLRSRASSPQIAVYPPYYVPGVPAMVPIAPPSLVDTTMMSAPPSVSESSAAGGGYWVWCCLLMF